MNDSPGFLLAFGAGLLSFLSPCVLPMLPAYLGFLTGMSRGNWPAQGPDAWLSATPWRSWPASASCFLHWGRWLNPLRLCSRPTEPRSGSLAV
ncbi:cytochrome c biogenesis CcdA family protein [Deinococcus malanensis]|uniref:cytochrome c biogenesis CcdA family protein n=1 Tax=Deinococcus malanensis TaxID=1706855 RepID=UPI003627B5CE